MNRPNRDQHHGDIAHTVGEWLRAATADLRACGIDTPGLDARLLLGAAAGMSGAAIIAHPERLLARDEQARLGRFLSRRLAREPVSRILGHREFYGRAFEITEATLDPRPDSETLIDAALELIDEEGWSERSLRILDIGTGSGCLLLTLLAELPRASGIGTDISAPALEAATVNAANLGLAARADFIETRSLEGIDGPFDIMVANPPYIPSHVIAGLAPEVRRFDPFVALDGGADGLDIYRQLGPRISQIVPKGWAIVEVGAGQAGAVSDILSGGSHATTPGRLRIWRDLGGLERVVATQSQTGRN